MAKAREEIEESVRADLEVQHELKKVLKSIVKGHKDVALASAVLCAVCDWADEHGAEHQGDGKYLERKGRETEAQAEFNQARAYRVVTHALVQFADEQGWEEWDDFDEDDE